MTANEIKAQIEELTFRIAILEGKIKTLENK